MQAAALKRAGELRDLAAFTFACHPQAQHGVNFVILYVQQSARAGEFAQQAHARRAKQRWHHADDAIRLPATLRHQREETAQGKAAQMK